MADTDRTENTLYYNCQTDPRDVFDYAQWYGINTYVYCNGTADKLSEAAGFQSLSESFESYNYSIPVLLTEYGCLSKSFPTVDGYQGQRNFNQAKWLGVGSVQNDFAGGLAFEYSIEAANAQIAFVSLQSVVVILLLSLSLLFYCCCHFELKLSIISSFSSDIYSSPF